MLLLGHPSRLVAEDTTAGTRVGGSGTESGRTACDGLEGETGATRGPIRGLIALRPVEFNIVVPMKAFYGGGIVSHRARAEDMVGDATAEATAEFGSEIADGSIRSSTRRLVMSVDGGARLRVLGGRVTLHCGFSRGDVSRRFEDMSVAAIITWVHFTKHVAHALFIFLEGVPTFDGERAEFTKGRHLAIFSNHSSEIEFRSVDGKVSRQ